MKKITFLGYPLGRTLLSSFLKNERMDAMSSFRCWRCRSMSSSVVEVPEFGVDDPHDDTKVMEKDNALRMALTQLAGDFCNESMLSLRRFFLTRRAPVISTGSLRLDLALGIGGLPKGRIVEIYGQEASGKTTLALHIIKEAQKLGGYCAYLDVENALDPMLAESMGVNTEELLISRPDSAENMLSVVNTLAKSGSMDVVVVDSVAALVPQYELDVHIGSTVRDLQPLIMNQGLRKIHASLGRSETLVIFVNQTRSNAKSGQGIGHAEEVTCGGNSLRFYAAVRMKTTRKRLFKTNDQFDSLGICVQVMKNKLAPAMRKVELKIEFGRGICFEFDDFLELACEKGIILMEGGSYFIEGEVLDNKEDAILHLAENEEILHTMITTLRKQLFRI